MAKHDKVVFIRLIRIFIEETDENNWMDLDEILQKLRVYMEKEQGDIFKDGFDITDRTIKTYMKELNYAGFEIMCETQKFGKKVYSHQDKLFNNSELLILMNTLNSFKFLCGEDTEKIKDKIRIISTKESFSKLDKIVYNKDNFKIKNDKVKYKINEISSALLKDRMLTFKYREYAIENNRVVKRFKYDGRLYEIDPYGVTLHSGKLYLVGKDRNSHMVKNYRVDMMGEVKAGNCQIEKNEFDFNDYIEKSMSMFGAGETIELKLRTRIGSIQNLKDHFGQELYREELDEDSIVTVHKVYFNQGLVNTLMKFGRNIEVLSPQCVRDKIRERAEELLRIYR